MWLISKWQGIYHFETALIEKYSHKERRSAQKTQAVIVFLKLDFDLPHINYRNFDEISRAQTAFSQKSRAQMMFSWNATEIPILLK